MKKIAIILVAVMIMSSLSACGNDEYQYKEKIVETREIVETTKNEDLKNLHDFSKRGYQQYVEEEGAGRGNFINEDKTLLYDMGDGVKTITYKQLVDVINGTLKKSYKDYTKKETLNYNYTETKDEGRGIYGKYINVKTIEEQTPDDYTKQVEKDINGSYTKEIVDINYLDKENIVYQKGVFKTREKDKKVEFEYNETRETEDVSKLIDSVEYDFANIVRFYEYQDKNNYKAYCKGNLKDFKAWTQIEDGVSTIMDFTATIKKTNIVKGQEVEKIEKITPIEAEFDYDMEVKDGVIKFKVDLTKAIKEYYKVFTQYSAINIDYEIEIYNNSEKGKKVEKVAESKKVDSKKVVEEETTTSRSRSKKSKKVEEE